ncbi:MAG: hypothetical protein K5841_07090, partial [Fretibacterium sp.]|nr:hypothetical protein [Fretibacterium sp.]
MRRHGFRAITLPLFILLLVFACPYTAWPAALSVTVTQPWLALIASFIGGSNVEVHSLQEWNAEGELVSPTAKVLRALTKDEY